MIKNSNSATQYRFRKISAIILLLIFFATAFPSTALGLDGGGSWANAAQQAVYSAAKIAASKFRKQLLDTIVNQIIAWINDDKKPSFVSDFPKVLKETADTEAMIALQDVTSKDFVEGLCQPGWAVSIKATLSKSPTFGDKAICSSDQLAKNYHDFMDHFTTGGWSNWISISESNSNPYMVYMTALDEKLTRQAAKQSEKTEDHSAGGGFLSDKVCVTMTHYASQEDADNNNVTVENPLTYSEEDIKNLIIKDMQNQEPYHDRKCVTWETRSPGRIMADAAKEGIFKDVEWLKNNEEWESYVVALGDALVNRLTKEGVKAIKSYDVKAGDAATADRVTAPPVTSVVIANPWSIRLKSNKPGKTAYTLDGTDPAFYSKSLIEYKGESLAIVNSTNPKNKLKSLIKWRSMDGDSNTETTRKLDLIDPKTGGAFTTPFDLTQLKRFLADQKTDIPTNIQTKLYNLVTDPEDRLGKIARDTSIPQTLIDELKSYIAIEDYRLSQTPPIETVIPINQLVPLKAMAANSTLYNIYWSTTPGVTITSGKKIIGVTSPYTHAKLTNGTTYYYLATAVNNLGESGASNKVSATPLAGGPVFAAPSIIATVGVAKNVINWHDITGATSYNIYWSTTPGVTTANGKKIIGATRPYTHADLINGVTYYYIATAVSSLGESDASNQISATPTTTTPPSTPKITASADDAQNVITVGAVTDPTSYTIQDFINLTAGIPILENMYKEAANIQKARAALDGLIKNIKTYAKSGFKDITITDLAKTLEVSPELKGILDEVNAIITERSLVTLETHTYKDAAGIEHTYDGWDETKIYPAIAAVDDHSFVLLSSTSTPSWMNFRIDKGSSKYTDNTPYVQKITLPDDSEYTVYVNAFDAAGKLAGDKSIRFKPPFPNAELPYLVDLVPPTADINKLAEGVPILPDADGYITLDPSNSIDIDLPLSQTNGGIAGYEWKFTDLAGYDYDWKSFDPNRDGKFETNGCVYAANPICPNTYPKTTTTTDIHGDSAYSTKLEPVPGFEEMKVINPDKGIIKVKLSSAAADGPSKTRTIKLRVTDNEGLWTEKTATVALP